MKIISIIMVAYLVAIIVILATLIITKYRKYFLPMKIISSLLFLILGTICAIYGRDVHFRNLLAGLFFCFIGDVILGYFNIRKDKRLFISGTIVFLMGHLAFIVGSITIAKISRMELIIPIAAEIGIIFLIRNKDILLGKLKPFVYVYGIFLSGFLARSVSIFLIYRTPRSLLLMLGAIFFSISDLLILFIYFYRKKRWSTHGFNIATYYIAMGLIALSIAM